MSRLRRQPKRSHWAWGLVVRLDLRPFKDRLKRGYPGRALYLRLIDAKEDVAKLIREIEDARVALDGYAELIADGHLIAAPRKESDGIDRRS